MRKFWAILLLVFTILVAEDLVYKNQALKSITVTRTNIFERQAVPHIARTSDQKVHLVYCQDEGTTSKVYHTYSDTNGQTWSTPKAISTGYSYARNPLILIDNSDKLYVFWENSGGIFVIESLDKGHTWNSPFKVSGKFSEGRTPAAVISENGDIHLVWENAANIYYRSYTKKIATWSTIYDISKSLKASTSPVVTNMQNKYLYVAWLEQGEVVFRPLDLTNGYWGTTEEVSKKAARHLNTMPSACDSPVILVDASDMVHAFWTNKNQLLHRLRVKGKWSPITSQLSKGYVKSISKPTAVADSKGTVYLTYIEQNTIFVQKFNSGKMTWKTSRKLRPKTAKILYSPQLGGNFSINSLLFNYQTGYDLAWLEQNVGPSQKDIKIRFNSQAEFPEAPYAPKIIKVSNRDSYPYIRWSSRESHKAFQIVISDRNLPHEPYLYDSKKVESPLSDYVIKNFHLKPRTLYFFVRTMNEEGQWSNWSNPYIYKAEKDVEGPLLEITEIEEDSLYLYSPDGETLYYGNGLEQPKEFIIRGIVNDQGSGLKKILFSPAFGTAPPPLYDLVGDQWAVRYTIKSADDPGTIIITAMDHEGLSSTKVINVLKDTTPPEPPNWVRIYPDKNQLEQRTGPTQDNDRTVFVTWVNGIDKESGIRYHLLGTSPKWWQNSIHQPGDSEEGAEGENIFYVFAVDNVGNVSEPNTDKILIDSLPPDKPTVTTLVTSTNYFYGIRSPDTVDILVNGVKDNVKMIGKDRWKYRHHLRDGHKELFNLQAIDGLGNKSEALEVRLAVDKTPPTIFYADHNAGKDLLRINDKLIATIKGDIGNQGSFHIEGLTKEIPMYDDGTRGDIRADDAIYTGIYYIDTELSLGKRKVITTLTDPVGNQTKKKTINPVIIDSSKTIVLDNFENKGDQYPWKNYCHPKNISQYYPDYRNFKFPEGKGCLKVEYDFNGQQSWAGLASHEFRPKNLYGTRAYLNFWLKGSGSEKARLFIYLEGENRREIVSELPTMDKNYSVPLSINEWKRVTLPIPLDFLTELGKVTKYKIIVFSDNEEEKGEFYIDNLAVSYQIPRASSQDYYPKKQKDDDVFVKVPGNFGSAPYLTPELYPNPLKRNSEAVVKLPIPKRLSVQSIYINWGQINEKLFSTKLTKATSKVWKTKFKVPANLPTGEHFATIYVRTTDNRFYKKEFPYKVVAQQNTQPYDQVITVFTPHPLIPKIGTTVKVVAPASIKAKTIVVFFGEHKGEVYSASLIKKTTVNNREYWVGSVTLPDNIEDGYYTALIYIKTKDYKFIKKKASYAVERD